MISVFYVLSLSGQCTYQVTHLAGTMDLNGVEVTVTSEGFVDSNSGYCVNTLPYFIGYSYSLGYSGTGSYSFNFSPPVSELTLNFSGLSKSAGHEEEVHLFVNGNHYAIPEAGTLNGCDPMAVLTTLGNITACDNCSVSGWMGTTVPGPIYSLMVMDTVYEGNPAGSIFSLFICDSISVNINENSNQANYHFSPSPFVDQTTLNFRAAKQKVTLTLYNLSGQLIRKIDNISGNQVTIQRDGLPSGIYSFMLKTDERIIATGKLLAK